jgi:predicted Zn-dependent protease
MNQGGKPSLTDLSVFNQQRTSQPQMAYGYGFPRRSQSLFGRGNNSGLKIRLLIAAVMVGFAVIGYFSKTHYNPITGDSQRVGMTENQEVQLGLQAAPELINQFGGYYQDRDSQRRVEWIGTRLVQALNEDLRQREIANPYHFDFHLLADDQTINAFALPGGQVFITYALFRELNDAQLAGVLGHEIGHVLERHGAQRMAKEQLTQGLAGAAGIAGGSQDSARLAQMIGSMVNIRYGQKDELESDRWGVRLAARAGYNPEEMLIVMDILEKAGGGNTAIFSSHPPPPERKHRIREYIDQEFPHGLPPGLEN